MTSRYQHGCVGMPVKGKKRTSTIARAAVRVEHGTSPITTEREVDDEVVRPEVRVDVTVGVREEGEWLSLITSSVTH